MDSSSSDHQHGNAYLGRNTRDSGEADAGSASDASWDSQSSVSCNSELPNIYEDFHNENEVREVGQPYTSLSGMLLQNYYPIKEDESEEDLDNLVEYRLPLNDKLPIMHALDTLQDISKVLKVGKLTPRMERIMEYKMDHPYSEGYDDEGIGCCQWVVYKLSSVYEKFRASQWPYHE